MGGKYHIRTDEPREFGDTTDYYLNSLWEVIKLRISKKGRILFITRHYY